MARPNRIRLTGAYYHVTSRIVNKERWLSDPDFKDRIVDWMCDIADFAGIELLDWAVMDNHFHIHLHVPDVPEEHLVAGGDAPRGAIGDTPGGGAAPSRNSHPSFGGRPRFMPPDGEVVRRLAFLYGRKRAEVIGKAWEDQRARGLDSLVDARKARFCRRMYDVSEYVKTLKERISAHVNRTTGHVGAVFEGRFHGGIVEGGFRAGELVSLYVAYNPFKAGLTRSPAGYRWTSFAAAHGDGPRAARCRLALEKTFGRPWKEVRAQILAAFADRLPDGVEVRGRRVCGLPKGTLLRFSQVAKLRLDALSRGSFVAHAVEFGRTTVDALPKGFSRPSLNSLRDLLRVVDWDARWAA